MIIIAIIVNCIFLKKKRYLGIRILITLITLFAMSLLAYNIYGIVKGNIFKNKIAEICDESKSLILTSKDITSYNVRYIPDKFYIDAISKGGSHEGYIKFLNSDEYRCILWSDTTITRKQYIIIYNSNRYYFNYLNRKRYIIKNKKLYRNNIRSEYNEASESILGGFYK